MEKSVRMKSPITVCANEKCESVIREGQRVWHHGKDLFCHSKCLLTVFGIKYEKPKREKTKQERIQMMHEVYARRNKARKQELEVDRN